MPDRCKLLVCLFLAVSLPISAYADSSPFDSPELTIQPAPAEAKTLNLQDSETVVDLEVAAGRPEAAFIPERFHPAGNVMLWENGNHCFQKVEYEENNWYDKPENLVGAESLCGGGMAYTPNGADLLHWQSGKNGVELVYDRGKHTKLVADGTRFLSMPSSVPDGRGLVGVTESNGREAAAYIPIDVPLADVANAWMFLQSTHDRELLVENSGLFRSLDDREQLYQLYDSESYSCGHDYNEAVPTRPYLVSTDIFWELYAAAFEGIFILSERESAIPAFWDFVTKASTVLNAGHPNSKTAKVFSTLVDIHNGRVAPDSEAGKIMRSDGVSPSLITGKNFDFGNLKPRGHYVTDTELQKYFRASKYLTDIDLPDDDIASLKSLPQPIQKNALAWIKAYEPFIAPSRSPLIWYRNARPNYIQSPPKLTDKEPRWPKNQVFPLSWGVDNEIFYNVVYHNASEARLLPALPAGLDIPAVLGSQVAEEILEQSGDFVKYPILEARVAKLRARLRESKAWSKPDDGLYERWLEGRDPWRSGGTKWIAEWHYSKVGGIA